jgi:hypothetical protein
VLSLLRNEENVTSLRGDRLPQRTATKKASEKVVRDEDQDFSENDLSNDENFGGNGVNVPGKWHDAC